MSASIDAPRVLAARARHDLLREVVTAREQLRRSRATGAPAHRYARDREQLRHALERFAGALADCHLPVPYAVRDELRLLQNVP
jgi:hypothetical protein